MSGQVKYTVEFFLDDHNTPVKAVEITCELADLSNNIAKLKTKQQSCCWQAWDANGVLASYRVCNGGTK